ncbi:hypothetical protein Fmac_024807 [Flemingia macrophylla]|uniref:Uncharacterized protein n=1 Tax=Flemingia macrophylla TaxID=520843 RepID=A0ABD1LQF3_9FABA
MRTTLKNFISYQERIKCKLNTEVKLLTNQNKEPGRCLCSMRASNFADKLGFGQSYFHFFESMLVQEIHIYMHSPSSMSNHIDSYNI